MKLQEWTRATGARIVVLFEGRDAAGKGGTIKRITEYLSPRTARIAALPAPGDREKGQWYFQRYIEHLPTKGEIVLFDRSWYNRAGVERVMGFCTPQEEALFLRQCPIFEQMLIDDGILLRKYWFSVSEDEQLRRFKSRLSDPLRRWKLCPMDMESIYRWEDYSRAKDDMMVHTDTPASPWFVVESHIKKHARLNMIAHLLSTHPLPGGGVGEGGHPQASADRQLPPAAARPGHLRAATSPPPCWGTVRAGGRATDAGLHPGDAAMLQQFVADGLLHARSGTAFAVTPALREAYAEGDDEELAEVALGEAALASLRLMAAGRPRLRPRPRRCARRRGGGRRPDDTVTLRPDLDDAVVRLERPVTMDQVVAVYVDNAAAEPAVRAAHRGHRRRRPRRRGRRTHRWRRPGPRPGLVRHPGVAVPARPALKQRDAGGYRGR